MTKVLKNGDKNYGGGRVGDNNILTFSSHCIMPLSCIFLYIFVYLLN